MAKPATLDDLHAQLQALTRRLDGLEEDRRDDGAIVQRLAAKVGVVTQEPDEESCRDAAVPCPKCGAKVGYYDEAQDLVRTRHREHLVWMRMGPGGVIVIVCRKCSYPVEVSYRPPDDTAQAEIRDGLLVLDIATLSGLLQQALEGGSGQVTLRVR